MHGKGGEGPYNRPAGEAGTHVSSSFGASSHCRRHTHCRSKDTPSTQASVPHWSSSYTPCCSSQHKNSCPRSSIHHFHSPSSSCLPNAAVPTFLPVPFSALFLFSPTFCLFLTLTSSLPQPAHSLSCTPPFASLHIAQ